VNEAVGLAQEVFSKRKGKQMRLQGWEWIIILAIVLLLWGGPKLPGLAKSLAQSMRVFRKEIKSTDDTKPAAKPAEGETPDDK
jgi:sec-independent protein translocase protein TatA